MNEPASLDDRVARGLASRSVTNDEIIPFDEAWGEKDLAVSLARGESKDKIFELWNSDWSLTLYRYRSATAAIVQIVLRMDDPSLTKKFIRPLHVRCMIGCRPHVVALGLKPLRPLYGLDRLAASPKANVILVEGEKAADEGQRRFPDHVVMTWQNGAQGTTEADFRPLANRHTIVWPDNDDGGAIVVRKLPGILTRAGVASARVVQIPAYFPPKWDLADPVPTHD